METDPTYSSVTCFYSLDIIFLGFKQIATHCSFSLLYIIPSDNDLPA